MVAPGGTAIPGRPVSRTETKITSLYSPVGQLSAETYRYVLYFSTVPILKVSEFNLFSAEVLPITIIAVQALIPTI